MILALMLGFAILVYTLKEKDNEGYYALFICLAFIVLGILCIRSARKQS